MILGTLLSTCATSLKHITLADERGPELSLILNRQFLNLTDLELLREVSGSTETTLRSLIPGSTVIGKFA